MLGFGPFASHKVNASWVAVQELVQTGGLGDDINLVTVEIPVAYDNVTIHVPDIWKTYQPKVLLDISIFLTNRCSFVCDILDLRWLAVCDFVEKIDVRSCREM